MMTTPGPNEPTSQQDSPDDATTEVPAAAPAYATPPPEGLPDADND